MKLYLTADTHFGDDGAIIRYENRPFADGEDMKESLIASWNRVVQSEDTIYHLGDFSSGLTHEETEKIIRRLNGRKILIMGNHDRHLSPRQWMELGFDEVYPMPVIFQGFYMLSHEPLYINWASPYANIFGHVHNNPAYKDVSSRSFCACVERTGYAPIDFESVKAAIFDADRKEREKNI